MPSFSSMFVRCWSPVLMLMTSAACFAFQRIVAEHRKRLPQELVFVLVAVPVDELALDHGKSDDGVIHARERLIHPRPIPRALCGNVDVRKLTVLVVISEVVVLHTPPGCS